MTNDFYNVGKRYWWYNEESQKMLEGGYLLKGETVEDAVNRVAHACSINLQDKSLFPIFKEIIEKGWISLSSPIWANMGTERGFPISCFNVHVPDSMIGVADKLGEVIMQTKFGGGTSGYFGHMRPRGSEVKGNGKATGSVSFMRLFDSVMETVSQGDIRKGAFASYLDIEHPDIEEFLEIRSIGNPIQNLYYAVCVSDEWMNSMIEGDQEKRNLWAKVHKSRIEKGMPYIFFKDNVNNNKPDIYKKLGININSSNLCTEIMLPSTDDESFVCCLCSMNLELYDEWKDTDAVKMAIYLLDAVMTEFINKTEGIPYFEAANKFSKNHRALGLGVLGWHSYLQKNMIPFESIQANAINHNIFKQIREQSESASIELGEKYGHAPIYDRYTGDDVVKKRNATLLAVAPTTSSAAILGQVSTSIEPYNSNYFKAGLAKGNFMRKNKYLKSLFEKKGIDSEEIWKDIMMKNGSVQHLAELTEEEKNVFKTFKEIPQMSIIVQASTRQKFIDQGQSVNINIPPSVPVKETNKLIIEAWKLGLKTLYYQRSQSVAKELVGEIVSCSACEA